MIISGIFNINKPAGMTSHDVVYRVRRLTGIKKVGHGGTLDPMATGVLPVFVGSATRVIEYLEPDFKKYRCRMKLGLVTDTQDVWGTVIEERPFAGINRESVEAALKSFCGPIKQTPPMYSAVRVKGKRLYEYARKGQTVEVKPREVYIKEISLEDFDEARGEAEFTVECSKGTYVRTICAEAGEKLGCGAAMSALTRTATGAFKIEEAITLADLESMGAEEAAKLLLPADFPLTGFGRAFVDEAGARAFINGTSLPEEKVKIEKGPAETRAPGQEKYAQGYCVYGAADGGILLGVAFFDKECKRFKADKVLFRGEIIERI